MDNQDINILIVDDEEDIVEMIRYNLEKEGFSVSTAKDGKEAIEVAEKQIPDIIILDIMMPEMDGVEVCKHLRGDNRFDNTIIAFLTARNEDYSQIAALDVGGDDYITKPIRPNVLKSRIKALLRRSGRSQEEENQIIKIADLVIDKEKFLVQKNGVEVALAKKEFSLILLLISKPGKVFTREEIFTKVWGPEVIVGNRTIDVHIRKLREKLGETCIKTIKGIGYKFEF